MSPLSSARPASKPSAAGCRFCRDRHDRRGRSCVSRAWGSRPDAFLPWKAWHGHCGARSVTRNRQWICSPARRKRTEPEMPWMPWMPCGNRLLSHFEDVFATHIRSMRSFFPPGHEYLGSNLATDQLPGYGDCGDWKVGMKGVFLVLQWFTLLFFPKRKICTDVNLEDLKQFISLSYKAIHETLNPLQARCSPGWRRHDKTAAAIAFTLLAIAKEQRHNSSFPKFDSREFDSWPPFSHTIFPLEIIINCSIRFWDKPWPSLKSSKISHCQSTTTSEILPTHSTPCLDMHPTCI